MYDTRGNKVDTRNEWERRHQMRCIEDRLPDDCISLIKEADNSFTIELYTFNEAETAERVIWLNRCRRRVDTDDMLSILNGPSTYVTSTTQNSVVFKGDIHEMKDALEAIRMLRYISKKRTQEIQTVLTELWLKECRARDRQKWEERNRALEKEKAEKKEAHIRKKYTRLAEKHGMDPNIIFASLEQKKEEEVPKKDTVSVGVRIKLI